MEFAFIVLYHFTILFKYRITNSTMQFFPLIFLNHLNLQIVSFELPWLTHWVLWDTLPFIFVNTFKRVARFCVCVHVCRISGCPQSWKEDVIWVPEIHWTFKKSNKNQLFSHWKNQLHMHKLLIGLIIVKQIWLFLWCRIANKLIHWIFWILKAKVLKMK